MAAAGLKAVYQWVMRTMMKSKGETGIVKTLPNKDLVELNTQSYSTTFDAEWYRSNSIKKC